MHFLLSQSPRGPNVSVSCEAPACELILTSAASCSAKCVCVLCAAWVRRMHIKNNTHINNLLFFHAARFFFSPWSRATETQLVFFILLFISSGPCGGLWETTDDLMETLVCISSGSYKPGGFAIILTKLYCYFACLEADVCQQSRLW